MKIYSTLVNKELNITVSHNEDLVLDNPQELIKLTDDSDYTLKNITKDKAQKLGFNKLITWFQCLEGLIPICQLNPGKKVIFNDQDLGERNKINISDVNSTNKISDYNLLHFNIYPKHYIMLDIETTGLNFHSDRITQIAMLEVKNQQIINKFNALINPEKEIPQNVQKLTGIKNEDLKNKPKFKNIIGKFEDFLQDLPIIGHNIENFDLKMISSEYATLSKAFKDHFYLDTLTLAHKKLPYQRSYRLQDLKLLVGGEIGSLTSHNAYHDVLINKYVYEYLLKA